MGGTCSGWDFIMGCHVRMVFTGGWIKHSKESKMLEYTQQDMDNALNALSILKRQNKSQMTFIWILLKRLGGKAEITAQELLGAEGSSRSVLTYDITDFNGVLVEARDD